MHSLTEVGTNVPAFLAKLWKLVEDPETNDLICWNDNGSGFVIHNQAQFCRELLPLYYKHNNMASFVRQLNMYGFHKKVSVDAGGLKLDRDEMEFAHPCFLRNQAFLLENIKRKIAENVRGVGKTPEVINRVLGDVKQMKGRQENLDTKLSSMKRENEALWRELAVLRQKHHKQQQIVNKLIQFLLTVVQSPGNRLGIKRRYTHLMLHDKEHVGGGDEHHHHRHHHHKHKHHRQGPEATTTSASATVTSPLDDLSNEMRNGPTIHELDPNSEFILPDDKMDETEESRSSGIGTPSPQQFQSPPSVSVVSPEPDTNPDSPSAEQDIIPSELLLDETNKPTTSSDLALMSNGGGDDTSQTSISRWASHPLGDELDNHLDSMQTDLDGLKELLMSKDSCNLDANTLLSLFADDPVSLGMGLPSQEDKDDDIIGSELIAYNPTLFDLTEEMGASNDGMEGTSLFADDADNLLEQGNSMGMNSELTTPNPKMECPDFSEPNRKRKK